MTTHFRDLWKIIWLGCVRIFFAVLGTTLLFMPVKLLIDHPVKYIALLPFWMFCSWAVLIVFRDDDIDNTSVRPGTRTLGPTNNGGPP